MNKTSRAKRVHKNNFKGFGMKEASHLLRNLGYEGYCIIDKMFSTPLKN
jgi:thermostable 8-oxoguanine DNA glycosylase